MLMVASEGRHYRYEVCEHSDGYLVQMRDLATGDVPEDSITLFRTMPVAFAFAEMAAANDRRAVLDEDDDHEDGMGGPADFESTEGLFRTLSQSLQDTGVTAGAMKAWEQARQVKPRRVVH